MQTLLVEIKDSTGLKILQDLEQANIIRLLPGKKGSKTEKLSQRLRGSISKETAKEMQIELEKMRKEWQKRNI